jgi:hypothetical protein
MVRETALANMVYVQTRRRVSVGSANDVHDARRAGLLTAALLSSTESAQIAAAAILRGLVTISTNCWGRACPLLPLQ